METPSQRFQTSLFSTLLCLALSLCASPITFAQALAPAGNQATDIATPPSGDASAQPLSPFTILPPPGDSAVDGGRLAADSAFPVAGDQTVPSGEPISPHENQLPPVFIPPSPAEAEITPEPGELPPTFVPQSIADEVPVSSPADLSPAGTLSVDTAPIGAGVNDIGTNDPGTIDPPPFVPNPIDTGPPRSPVLDTAVLDDPRNGRLSDGLLPTIDPREAHLDSVFPSLPSPPTDIEIEKPAEFRIGALSQTAPPSADGIPRVAQYGEPGIMFPGQQPPDALPQAPTQMELFGQFMGWWQPYVSAPMRSTSMPRGVSINGLVAATLQYSSQVKVISDSPLIRDTAIIEADAAFDWATFMETAWNNTNEPVGSTLTTGGGLERLRDSRFDFEAGMRRQTGVGGRFEASQRYGHETSNSIFFVPNDQGTGRLTLSYTQPLMRGAGRPYNTSLIVLAQVDSAIARDDFSRQLQEHLLDVTQAYWTLYLERATLLQRQRLYDRGREILQQLEYRETIDAVQNQIVRARAAVASRKSDLFRAAAAVKNAEGRIRALVNAPDLGVLDELELTPDDQPTTQLIPIEMRDSLETAIRNRPEINVAMKQIKASAIRKNMSKNELLPILDVVLETYVAGLRGNSSIGGAVEQQFTDGGPSYTAGLQFEVPLRNRAARARFQRRNLELRQFENQFQNTLQALQLEVEISVREVHTSYREIEANFQAMNAANAEVDYIAHRWELLPGEDRSASFVLEDLLAAQERLAAEEFEFANAQVNYNLALTNLKRAMGTLLQFEQVAVAKSEECGIPSLWLHKADGTPTSQAQPMLEFGPE